MLTYKAISASVKRTPLNGGAGEKFNHKQRGSALLATLCFAAVLSLTLSSYLAVCYRSLVLSNRNLQSSHGIELAEVGMEEALWAMNNNLWTGWTISGSTATKTLTGFNYENGASGQVRLTVTNYNKTIANFAGAPLPNINITSVGVMTLADNTTISRTLQSDARPAQLFTNAIGATGSLTFTSGGTVDSYDSTVANYTPTNPAALTAANSAAVVSGANVNVGNAQIYGFAATGNSTLQNGFGASVVGPSTPSGTYIDPTRVSNNASQPLYDVTNPVAVNSYDPVTHSSQLTNSTTISTTGAYQYDSIQLDNSHVLTIDAPNVVIKVTNSVYITDGSQIHVKPNGSLLLQIGEADNNGLSMDNGGGIVNDSRDPGKVSVVVGSLNGPSSTSSINTSIPFYGSIYLPNDTVNISSNNFTLYGALVAKTVNVSDSGSAFHYDTSLQRFGAAGVSTPFALVQLREL